MQTEPQTESQEIEGTNPEPQKTVGGPSVPFINPKRAKPTQVLPSDRLALEKQLGVLRAFVIGADAEGGSVTNEKVGEIIGMSGNTVVVANAFFTETGLLIRGDSGKFSPSQYARDYEAAHKWGPTTAGVKLAPAFQDCWFTRVLVPRLKMRNLTKTEAMAFLAEACKASPEYQPRLEMILEFLNVAGIVSFEGSELRSGKGVTDGNGTDGGSGGRNPPPPPMEPPAAKKDTIPADAPFYYLDPKRTKKVVLVADATELTKAEWKRLQSWFQLQFFVTDDGKPVDMDDPAFK